MQGMVWSNHALVNFMRGYGWLTMSSEQGMVAPDHDLKISLVWDVYSQRVMLELWIKFVYRATFLLKWSHKEMLLILNYQKLEN